MSANISQTKRHQAKTIHKVHPPTFWTKYRFALGLILTRTTMCRYWYPRGVTRRTEAVNTFSFSKTADKNIK